MKNLKHIGRMKNTGSKVLVIFRTLPGESNNALVLPVTTLPDAYHDALMNVVETDEAQQAFEFGEVLFTRMFPDGRPMLRALQADAKLVKVPTDSVVMTPTPQVDVPLSQLNVLIAEQKNCSVDDLCTFVQGAPAVDKSKKETKETVSTQNADKPLTDLDLARSLRSQADALYKEAAKLRKQADDLDPPKKKTKTAETVDAKSFIQTSQILSKGMA